MLMKKTMKRLLAELLKNSKRSDREISRLLGVSQPTITRMRSRLVKEGMIKEFTIIPDLTEMGFEIMAINCFRSRVTKEHTDKARKVAMANPNIIFSARCQGEGKNGMIISLHKSFADYSRFISNIISEGGGHIEEHETFLISLNDFIAKPFSLKYIAELYEK